MDIRQAPAEIAAANPPDTGTAAIGPVITWLYGGSPGGKGQGLLNLGDLLYGSATASPEAAGTGQEPVGAGLKLPTLPCALPRTGIIGTLAWKHFMDSGRLTTLALRTDNYPALRAAFMQADLPEALVTALDLFLPARGRPLMVRSSSVLEDNTDLPFAGIYESYPLPNIHPSREERLTQLCNAVKLVYASLYSPGARAYRSAVAEASHELPARAEAMAVIVQELVGQKRGKWYYPLVSGTAQSLNYYAVSHARPEDGLCTAALGLGTYVVEGGASQQFCPRWPGMQMAPPELAGSGSQTSFCALDAEMESPRLVDGTHATLGDLSLADAEGTGALDYVASTWDRDDLRLVPGTSVPGPRIIDLSPILKYDALPLAPALRAALTAAEVRTQGPVELEYALDEAPDGSGPTLYLLQLKKLRRPGAVGNLNFDSIAFAGNQLCVIRSDQALGEGIIQNLYDLIWLPLDRFDRSRSMEAAEEVATLDRALNAEGRSYILIGPGRWGSRDPWLGVPVDYSQITKARIIVETGMPGMSVDFSFGSHFMRNVSGLGLGYLAIPEGGPSRVDWDYIASLPRLRSLRFAVHSRCPRPLEALLDGVGRRALVRESASGGGS